MLSGSAQWKCIEDLTPRRPLGAYVINGRPFRVYPIRTHRNRGIQKIVLRNICPQLFMYVYFYMRSSWALENIKTENATDISFVFEFGPSICPGPHFDLFFS